MAKNNPWWWCVFHNHHFDFFFISIKDPIVWFIKIPIKGVCVCAVHLHTHTHIQCQCISDACMAHIKNVDSSIIEFVVWFFFWNYYYQKAFVSRSKDVSNDQNIASLSIWHVHLRRVFTGCVWRMQHCWICQLAAFCKVTRGLELIGHTASFGFRKYLTVQTKCELQF